MKHALAAAVRVVDPNIVAVAVIHTPESYDAQKDDGDGWGYTYDAEKHMKTVTGVDGKQLFSTEYDLSGNLTAETDAAGRTSYRKYTPDGQLQPIEKQDEEILWKEIKQMKQIFNSLGNIIFINWNCTVIHSIFSI